MSTSEATKIFIIVIKQTKHIFFPIEFLSLPMEVLMSKEKVSMQIKETQTACLIHIVEKKFLNN